MARTAYAISADLTMRYCFSETAPTRPTALTAHLLTGDDPTADEIDDGGLYEADDVEFEANGGGPSTGGDPVQNIADTEWVVGANEAPGLIAYVALKDDNGNWHAVYALSSPVDLTGPTHPETTIRITAGNWIISGQPGT